MKLGSLGVQIVLKSEKAFSQTKYVAAETVKAKIYFPKYKIRDSKARSDYLQHLRSQNVQDGIYLIDIVRKPELLDDLRL